MSDPQQPLKDFRPAHEFIIAIDSDGCAFDTMELKQKECFIPSIVKHWKLQAVSKHVREAAEFVNLYSQWRGINRFPALLMVFDLLAERTEVQRRGVRMPEVRALREWLAAEPRPGSPALKEVVEKTGDPVLSRALGWSEAVNATVAEFVHGVPPFPLMRECLEKANARADLMVVSATPCDALNREWDEHDIAKYMAVIAGQEMGKKADHLRLATRPHYRADHILMIGDAPGDMKAARTADALFFPVRPSKEDESWELFHDEALERFFAGAYAGDYEAKLIEEFVGGLPDTPPWKR